MSELQLTVSLLCFWPVVAIALPFFLWLGNERMLRFGVRTLLIATTLVAVGLGLIVAVLRRPAG
jgi:hypothetical protein